MSNRRFGRAAQFRIESLESRRTPSASSASVAQVASASSGSELSRVFATSPGDGETLDVSAAPDTLTLRLLGLPAEALSVYGIALDRIEEDGTETAILDGNDPDKVHLDSATGVLAVRLASPLEAGRYRVVLKGGSELSRMTAQGRWDWTRDQTLSQFEVTRAAARPKDVTTLGAIGPKLRQTTGSLPEGGAAEATYRIRLAGNQSLWRLGLQLDAGRIGSDLLASLKVYDAAGRVVAAARVGEEIPLGVPNDPYLFVGLAPGEYQVVVSKLADQPGGDFRLNLVADPATEPTRVTGFTVDRTNGAPTGFTIAFSSPIDPGRMTPDAIRVVDATGAVRVARLSNLDPDFSRVSFAFDGALPAGAYRLLAAGDEPLADLIGRVPRADGLPAGDLARWTVAPYQATNVDAGSPTDYLRGELAIRPRTSVDVPLSLTAESSLVLTTALSGTISVQVLGRDGQVVRDLGTGPGGREYPLILSPGSYLIRISAAEGGTAKGSWKIALAANPASYFIGNAIGNRGMIDVPVRKEDGATGPPSAAGPTSSIAIPPAGRSSTGAAATGVMPGRIGAAYAAGPLASTSGATPLGKPSTGRDGVPAVGPTVPQGRHAVAWATPRVRGGPVASLVLSTSPQADDGLARGPAGLPEPQAPASTDDGAVARGAREGDDAALRRADLAAGLIPEGLRRLVDGPEASQAPAPAPTAAPAAPIGEGIAARSTPRATSGPTPRGATTPPTARSSGPRSRCRSACSSSRPPRSISVGRRSDGGGGARPRPPGRSRSRSRGCIEGRVA